MARPAETIRNAAQALWPGASVQERGRNYIVHAHPSQAGRFMLDTGLGPLHIAGTESEIDTAFVATTGAWQYEMVTADFHVHARNVFNAGNIIEYRDPASDQWVIFDPQSINWINQDLSRQQIAIKQAVNAVAEGDVLRFPGGYGAGRHFQYQAQTGRLQKLITIDSAANLPTPTVAGPSIWLELEFTLSTSAGVELYLGGVRWPKTNGVRVRTANRIEFRDAATGTQVFWWLDFPRAWDSAGNETVGEMEVRRSGGPGNLFITVRIPKAWVDTATFPIFLDPTIDANVAASADDSREDGTGACLPTATTFRLNTTGRWIAARWAASIPVGATIDVAYTQWYFPNTGTDDVNGTLYCEDVDSAAAYTTTTNDITARARTTATATWSQNDVTGGVAGHYSTPSLVGPVQEVVDRAGWASGNYIAVLYGHAGGTTWDVAFYDNNTAHAPKLHIEYTEAGGGTAFLEVVDETVNIDEVSQRLTGLLRSIAETVNIDEVIVRARTLARLIAETVNITETPTRLMAMIRQVAETVNIDEVTQRLTGLLRTVAETVNIDEAAARLRTYLRAIDETVNVDEVNQRLTGLLRSISETVNIDETIVRARTLARIVGETVNIDEAINRLKAMIRTVGETVNIAETIVDVLTNVGVVVIRVINETVNIGEATNRLMAMTRQIAETVNIDEVIVRTRTLARVIDETLNITESVNRLKSMARIIGETVNISETIVDVLAAAGAALVAVINEVVNVDEVTNRLQAMTRRIDETLNISETVNRAVTWIRTIDETVNITENIARLKAMSQVIDETVNISETVAGILGVVSGFIDATFKGMYRGMFRKMR